MARLKKTASSLGLEYFEFKTTQELRTWVTAPAQSNRKIRTFVASGHAGSTGFIKGQGFHIRDLEELSKNSAFRETKNLVFSGCYIGQCSPLHQWTAALTRQNPGVAPGLLAVGFDGKAPSGADEQLGRIVTLVGHG